MDSRVRKAAAPTIYHADLHKENIILSDDNSTIVTYLIVWQSSSIEPAVEYADESPDFAYGLVPKLSVAKVLDDTLLRPFRGCHITWRAGAIASRQELVQTLDR